MLPLLPERYLLEYLKKVFWGRSYTYCSLQICLQVQFIFTDDTAFLSIPRDSTVASQRLQFHVTYIHNCPLQPFSQDYGLATHTAHVVCVNFIREWWSHRYSLTSTPNDRFLRNFFRAVLFYSQSFCQKSLQR